jgi:hypothetical protein
MASTAPRDVKSPVASKHVPKAATTARPQQEIAPWFWKTARFLGSLQFAISTGVIFTLAMIVGTCLESWYSAKIAQQLVYYSWWFTALLGLLACAIFFAAIKKWPWKKHQIGFLITHVGLLTLLAGGVLNTFFGVDAAMVLVDSAQADDEGPRRSDKAYLQHETLLTVQRLVNKEGQDEWQATQVEVEPGPLPWGTQLQSAEHVPGLVRLMAILADPLPRTVSKQLEPDLQIDVLAHLPHTSIEPVEVAKPAEFGYPALKVEINSRDAGHLPGTWIALNDGRDKGPVVYTMPKFRNLMAEFLARAEPVLVDEFLKPPSDAERGNMGQLVFALNGQKHRIDVATQMSKTVPLGTTGWKVQIEKYVPIAGGREEVAADAPPLNPHVECTLTAPDGRTHKYRVTGRITMFAGALDSSGEATYDTPEGLPPAWYHAPDLRYSNDGIGESEHVKAVLQFLQTTDDKLYYRSLVERDGKMVLEHSGPAPETGVEKKIWDSQAANFIIEEHLPHAKRCSQRVEPAVLRPGLVTPAKPAALLCRLTLTKKDRAGNAKNFVKELWVPQSGAAERFEMTGEVNGIPFREAFALSFGFKQIKLGFELELTRAESLQDPGTNHPATYTSFVKLYDRARKIAGQDHMITMNEPLEHLGYKVYQSEFSPLGLEPRSSKPMHRSGFTIGRDPGIWLKYLGTAMLGVGIATMFFMKAYFFKPRARQVPATAV